MVCFVDEDSVSEQAPFVHLSILSLCSRSAKKKSFEEMRVRMRFERKRKAPHIANTNDTISNVPIMIKIVD